MKPKTAITILITIFILALAAAGWLYWKYKIEPGQLAEEQEQAESNPIPADKSAAADWAAERLKNNPNNTMTPEEKSSAADQAAARLKAKRAEMEGE